MQKGVDNYQHPWYSPCVPARA